MTASGRGRWWAAGFAVVGTAVLGLAAFWISFTALSDLARLAGIAPEQSWAWAAIVDGVIVTSTVAAVSLDGGGWRVTWFPWTLLAASAGVSVLANVLHALVASEGRITAALAGAIAAVPPLVLLAMTHLTVVVVRHARRLEQPESAVEPAPRASVPAGASPSTTARTTAPRPKAPRRQAAGTSVAPLRAEAERLRQEERLSNRKIAERLGVHRSTIGRWLPPITDPESRTEAATELPEEEGVPA